MIHSLIGWDVWCFPLCWPQCTFILFLPFFSILAWITWPLHLLIIIDLFQVVTFSLLDTTDNCTGPHATLIKTMPKAKLYKTLQANLFNGAVLPVILLAIKMWTNYGTEGHGKIHAGHIAVWTHLKGGNLGTDWSEVYYCGLLKARCTDNRCDLFRN